MGDSGIGGRAVEVEGVKGATDLLARAMGYCRHGAGEH